MNIADCYRLLQLKSDARLADIKASYRRLARLYHPDANPQNPQAHEKFIQLNQAYKLILESIPPEEPAPQQPKKEPVQTQPTKTKVTRKSPNFQQNPNLSDIEKQLKQQSYLQLQHHLKSKKFPRAIALIEGLAQRIPQDPEVRQWQAITYQRWARQLIEEKQIEKARIYLKKALRTDPHNRTLWSEVERDFRRLESIF
ncbi:DnaJ domain-containing protein [Ancylothrix sp. C2]|uniref:J domain-containing protein n=1 Tax=Ancylothrix sp. D3o TaxID=2953691 RepID=UPI0021BB4456|nr:DnaJ domain-containing protein [Ancylothrix sp. D3o]MCT7951331.1 DnaJ domain-containing protein [Ancylothrix sp. D3o]